MYWPPRVLGAVDREGVGARVQGREGGRGDRAWCGRTTCTRQLAARTPLMYTSAHPFIALIGWRREVFGTAFRSNVRRSQISLVVHGV